MKKLKILSLALTIACAYSQMSGACLFEKIPFISQKSDIVVNIVDSNTDELIEGMLYFENSGHSPVYIDGNNSIQLKPGKYQLKVLSDEYSPSLKEVILLSGDKKVIFFELDKIEHNYSDLHFKIADFENGNPVASKITLKGQDNSYYNCKDNDSLINLEMSFGQYEICIEREGYLAYSDLIFVSDTVFKELEIFIIKDSIRFILAGCRFENDKLKIDKESVKILDRLAKSLLCSKASAVSIECFTDDIGKSEDNFKKSKNRADFVKNYLVSKGVDEQIVKSEGYGELYNIAVNETEEGRKKNRRLEIIVSKK